MNPTSRLKSFSKLYPKAKEPLITINATVKTVYEMPIFEARLAGKTFLFSLHEDEVVYLLADCCLVQELNKSGLPKANCFVWSESECDKEKDETFSCPESFFYFPADFTKRPEELHSKIEPWLIKKLDPIKSLVYTEILSDFLVNEFDKFNAFIRNPKSGPLLIS